MSLSWSNRSILACLCQAQRTPFLHFKFNKNVDVDLDLDLDLALPTPGIRSQTLTLTSSYQYHQCHYYHHHRMHTKATVVVATHSKSPNKKCFASALKLRRLTCDILVVNASQTQSQRKSMSLPGIIKSSRSIVSQSVAKCQVLSCRHKLDTVGVAAYLVEAGDSNSDNRLEQTADFDNIVTASSSCLLKGGVIAVPTDTIYGLACLAQNVEAIERIYRIKGRNYEKPVAVSVGCIDNIYKWSNVTVPKEVLTDLLPGPVTVVFERSPELNPDLNPHTRLVGVRIPKHDFMQKLAMACEGPVALTSANISGSSSCLQIQEFEDLWPQLDLVVNGGILSDTEESRQGSTVVDLSVKDTFRIIRPGSAHQPTVSCLQDKHGLRRR